MSEVEKVLAYFRDKEKWGKHVAHWERIAPRPAQFGSWPENLNPDLVDAVNSMLLHHQN